MYEATTATCAKNKTQTAQAWGVAVRALNALNVVQGVPHPLGMWFAQQSHPVAVAAAARRSSCSYHRLLRIVANHTIKERMLDAAPPTLVREVALSNCDHLFKQLPAMSPA